jgi:preprotein translocase subunit YajC
MGPIVLFAFILVMGYFMVFRPMRQQRQNRAQMMSSLREGSQVLTVGGIYGRVLDLRADDLDLEVADGVVMRVDRRAVASVVDEPAALDEPAERADGEAD